MEKTITTESKITSEDVSELMRHINAGVASWVAAGKFLIQMTDKNPDAYEQIRSHNPRISVDTLICFERIGRREIYPELLIDNSPGARKLIALSYDLQHKFSSEKIQVVTGLKDQSPQTTWKFIHELSDKDAELIFSDDGVRTVEEQIPIVAFKTRARSKKPRTSNKSLGFFRIHVDNGKVDLIQVSNISKESRLPVRVNPDGPFLTSEIIEVFIKR